MATRTRSGRTSSARPAAVRPTPPRPANDSAPKPAAGNSDPSIGARVASTIHSAMTGGEIVSVGVLNLVRSTLVAVLGGVREIGAEIGSAGVAAVRGAIRAAAEIGGDLGQVAKQAVRGTIQAADEIGGDLGGVARSAARGAVRATAEVGGDVATVARRAVEGAADAAREIGADVAKIARSAADGALEAAEGIGGATGRAVRTGVDRVSGSVRELVAGRGTGASSNGRRRPSAVTPRRSTNGRKPVRARAGGRRGRRAARSA